MPFYKTVPGKKYFKLTAVEPCGGKLWLFRCDCGNLKKIDSYSVRTGETRSCRCYGNSFHIKHGACVGGKTREYRIWDSMIQRCLNKKTWAYLRYGGRGIKVCRRWLRFENFLKDMGKCPSGRSIERLNNDGDYGPRNCVWATKDEQSNNKCNTLFISFMGKRKSLATWSRIIGVHADTVYYRFRQGWSIKDVLSKEKWVHQKTRRNK